MTDWPLPSAFEPPTDPAALLDWLRQQEDRIADVVADVTTRIVRDAYRAYLDTLLPDAEPDAVTAAGDLSALDSIPQRWAIAASGRILPELNNMFVAGGIAAWTQSSGNINVAGEAWANVVNQQAVGYMKGASNRLAGVGNNVWWGVRSMVRKAVEDGATNEDLKRNIEAMTNFSEFRADTIARTETVGAFNNGEYAGNLALGDEGPVEKWWLATDDGRARPEHLAAQPPAMGGSGKVIPYGAPFLVGGVEMLHPHAPGAPAEQVVNCRCVLITLYPGDERPDGTIVPERAPNPNPPPTPPTPPPAPKPAKKAAPRRPSSRIPAAGFATADEAVDFLQRAHPQVLWGSGLRNGSAANLTAIARSSERLARRHPRQWAEMRAVTTETAAEAAEARARGTTVISTAWNTSETSSAYAHAWTGHAAMRREGLIGYNPKYLNDDAFAANTVRDKTMKWTVGDASMTSVHDHEFGHLYRYLRLEEAAARDGGAVKGFGYVTPEGIGTLRRTQVDLFEAARRRMEKWGSTYGGANHEEAFAECFAAREYLAAGGKATPGLKKMAAVADAFDELVDLAHANHGYGVQHRLPMLETIEAVYVKHKLDFRPFGWNRLLREAREAAADLE